ncbi:AurF N-oxygenase family protein [Rhodococcoides trifolii]|nr:diiron oxygenase [Rhodococcus trifolii]
MSTTSGGTMAIDSTVRDSTVGNSRTRDRQKTAARLLKSTANNFYDSEVDIDWDQPWVDGLRFMPDNRISLYGTALWNTLTPEQRIELGRNEIVSILSFGIYAELFLSGNLLRVATTSGLSDHSLYALAEIGEEARHSLMFGRAIEKMGRGPVLRPRPMITLAHLAQFLPVGPATYGTILLIEEVLDRAQREAMHDEGIQPHLRQLMKIHVLEEARHITYAREELVRGMARLGPVRRALHRVILAGAANFTFLALVHPSVYRSVGIRPVRGFVTAVTSETFARNSTFASDAMIRFFQDAGMLEGRVTKRLWKMTRAVPDDLVL